VTSRARFYRLLDLNPAGGELPVRTVRGGMVAMAAEGIDFVLRLGSIAILARLIVPEYFGLIGMVTAITTIAERFKDLGLSAATIQRPNITYEQVTNLFWVNAAVGATVAALIASLAIPIAHFYRDPRLVAITLALASTFIVSGLVTQHQALLRRNLQFGRLAAVQLTASVLSIVVAVVLALRGLGVWALVAREVVRAVVLGIGTWIAFPWLPGRPRPGAGIRGMLRFGGGVSFFNFTWFFASNVDQIVIGRLFGAVPLGHYRQSSNLVLAPITQLSFPVNTVAETALSRLQDDPARYRRYYRTILAAMCVVTMPLAGFFAVYAEELVTVLLGPRWGDAAAIFRVLAIAAFVRPAASTAGFVMVTCGKARRYAYWGLLYALGLLVFVLIGAQWGPVGVAGAQVAASYLIMLPSLNWAFRGTPLKVADFWRAALRPLVASLGMIAAAICMKWGVAASGPVTTLARGVAAAAVAFAVTSLLIPGGRAEIAREVGDIRAILRRDQTPREAGTPSPE
jgi:O-antigen/teichoic acid export membrane protein